MSTEGVAARPRRRGIAIPLVVLASVLAFVMVFALWIDRQVLDTDNWVESSSQMLDDPAIREQTAVFLTDELYDNVDVAAQIRAALPPRAQVLAAPAAGLLRDRIELRAAQALELPKVQELWENANRAAHTTLLKVLDGGGSVVSTEGGVVVLDLKTLLEDLEARSGVGGRVAAALPASAAQITILQSDQLATAQDVAHTLDGLPIVLGLLSLALLGTALLVAPGYRRESVRGYGAGLVVAGALALAVSGVGGRLARRLAGARRLRRSPPSAASGTSTTACSRRPRRRRSSTASWCSAPPGWAAGRAGPSRPARALAPYLREPAIAYGVLAAIVLVVIVWWAPTPAMRNPVTALVLAALLVLGLALLRRQTAREWPAETVERAGAAGPRRECRHPLKPRGRLLACPEARRQTPPRSRRSRRSRKCAAGWRGRASRSWSRSCSSSRRTV